MSAYTALIRTHHITSRKKVAALKLAAERHGCFALLRSGGSPGIMYVEGSEEAVRSWVSQVRVSLSVTFNDFPFLFPTRLGQVLC
jgi:hypothetical protein